MNKEKRLLKLEFYIRNKRIKEIEKRLSIEENMLSKYNAIDLNEIEKNVKKLSDEINKLKKDEF